MTALEDRYAKLNYKAMPEHAEGFQAFRVGYNRTSKIPDGPYPNGDRRVAWLVGWLDARTKASLPHLFCLMLWFVIASAAFAQTHISGTGHTPVPRMALHRPNVLTIPANTTVTLQSGEWDVIEIAGNAKVSRTADTQIKVTDIQILEGGTLDVGTETDPVLRKVEVIFRDTPLLTGTDGALGPDPEQFGNGIAVFGQFTTYGRKLTPTFTTHQPAEKGATTITVSEPVNWQVGDELLFHDTTVAYKFSPVSGLVGRDLREESKVTIQAISGQTITLSKPLDFEHQAVHGMLPYVANATRNIVFRSEKATGTRGHLMFMDRAHVSLEYTSFLDLGRTLPERINNTDTNSAHVGTNQIARYAIHWHHVHGHADENGLTGKIVGCYGYGSDIGKWFIVQHGTHDLLVADNVGSHFVGACYTTEDGYEVRGKYLRNLGSYCKGNGLNGKANLQSENNAPGAEGSPFWFHGSEHTLEGNVALCSAVGYSFVHFNQVFNRKVPTVPGGMNDRDLNPANTILIANQDNVSFGCPVAIETWRIPKGFTINKFTALNTASKGVFMGDGEFGYLTLNDCKFLNDMAGVPDRQTLDNILNVGISSSMGYTTAVVVNRCEFDNFHVALFDCKDGMIIHGCRLKSRGANVYYGGFDHPFFPLDIKDSFLERYYPTTVDIWLGSGSTKPYPYGEIWYGLLPTRRIINHNGTGKNYFLFENYAKRDAPAVAADGSRSLFTCPEPGMTVGQCFDKYGIAPGGYAAPADSKPLDGLMHGVAWEGSSLPPMPPKLILHKTEPNLLLMQNTWGEDPPGQFQLNNGPVQEAAAGSLVNYEFPSKLSYNYQVLPTGTNSLKASRKGVAGSELTFSFTNGTGPPDPEPTNQPPLVTAITINPPPPVYESSTVTYASSASDPNDDELSWVATYSYGSGSPIIYATGTGNSASWEFRYPAGPRTYTWRITFSDGMATAEKTLVVDVLAKPTDPPVDPPVPTEQEKRIKALEDYIQRIKAAFGSLAL